MLAAECFVIYSFKFLYCDMQLPEATELIKGGMSGKKPQCWADLGCGSGTFTHALKGLLPAGSRLTAIDKAPQRLPVNFVLADFEKDELPLKRLDGILMANSLHYVADKEKLIKKLEKYFLEHPAFLIVEYDTNRGNRWVPYPLSFDLLNQLFTGLGYTSVSKLSSLPSNLAAVYMLH
jgi:ubiquinone/menaquinone biosynthesis C-methylase UbiE